MSYSLISRKNNHEGNDVRRKWKEIEDRADCSTDLGRAVGLAAAGLLIGGTIAMIVGDAACAAYALSS